MNNNENKLNMIDLISVISFLVGLENLYENRQQSEQNDVQSANDRQAKFLLEELETKKMYESMYSQLCSMNEIATACKVKELIKDVDMELKRADRLHIKLQSMDYDLITIVLMQDEMHEHYDEKSKHIGVNIC